MGAIGRAVARRGRGFSMPVVYFNRNRLDPAVEQELGRPVRPARRAARHRDVVSLHAPLNDESRHLLDAAALARMKPTAVLVNTGRGALIDEAALVDGAARPARSRPPVSTSTSASRRSAEGLAALDNVVLAPHLGSATTDGRERRWCASAADNIVAVLAGRPRSRRHRPPLSPR